MHIEIFFASIKDFQALGATFGYSLWKPDSPKYEISSICLSGYRTVLGTGSNSSNKSISFTRQ